MTVKTECSYSAADLGKNLYRKRTYYTVLVEQEVIARDQDEADTLFLDNGGIRYGDLSDLVRADGGVETTIVDADFDRSDSAEYLGKVVYDEDNEFAKEDGDVIIDAYASETEQIELIKNTIGG